MPAELIAGAAAVVFGVAGGTYFLLRHKGRRRDPERDRRRAIELRGRLTEGAVTNFESGLVQYQWSWRGVDYTGSQDVRSLAERWPEGLEHFTGAVSVRFLPENPLNSIVLSENWSGFPETPRRNALDDAPGLELDTKTY